MRVGRLPVLGVLFPLVVTAACTPAADAPQAQLADVAVPSYAPPSGAPDFCATLAGTTHLTELPVALGTLAARPDDVGARLQLTAAADELKSVLDHVHPRREIGRLGSSLQDLLQVLRDARDATVTEAVRTKIGAGLDDVGRRAQALCRFPS